MNGPDKVAAGVLRLDDGKSRKGGAEVEVALLVAVDILLYLGRCVPFDVLLHNDLEASFLAQADDARSQQFDVLNYLLPCSLETSDVNLGWEAVNFTKYIG